jgi:phage replication-related protein YjqB (UPF0714/DUF867 family)
MTIPGETYCDFAGLAAELREGIDYRIVAKPRDSRVAVIAPHGGGIEQGTSELATAIAGREFSLYCFEGLKARGNERLHITSTRFDEPTCLRIVAQAEIVLAIHGCENSEELLFVGGQDLLLAERLMKGLGDAGLQPRGDGEAAIAGCHSANICNRGARRQGCQIEISRGLLSEMFEGLDRRARRRTRPRFEEFVRAARGALLQAQDMLD